MYAKPIMAAIVILVLLAGCQAPPDGPSSGEATTAPTRPNTESPIDVHQVLAECGRTDVVSPSVAAWASDLSAAAVVGKRGANHVLIIARRDPASPKPWLRRWMIAETSIMLSDELGVHDVWVQGERELPQPPTKRDILALCRSLMWDESRPRLDNWRVKD